MEQIICIVLGIFVGYLSAWFWDRKRVALLRKNISCIEDQLTEKKVAQAALECQLREQKANHEEKLALIIQNRDTMKSEFQLLATQILEDKGKAILFQNRENIGNILNPLREQIADFKKRVDDVYDKESQGRAALVNEISNLKALNLRVSEDATNLTKALKADSKVQGDWGQVILERVLEMAGLERGREYKVQVNSHDADGNRFLPDAVIFLPQNRQVIVDSKVSLSAFERYCSSQNDEERAAALKAHLASIRKHVDELSEKDYENLEEIQSTDCVLMFVPTESAYLVAIKEDTNIFADAFKKNIVLVCPSTLLSTVKIIAYLWRVEKQHRNTQLIVDKVKDIFDKLCQFSNVFLEMGDSIRKTQEKYDQSLKTLSTGKGNLIKRTEELRTLGVASKKTLPQKLLENNDVDKEEAS